MGPIKFPIVFDVGVLSRKGIACSLKLRVVCDFFPRVNPEWGP